MTPTRTAPTPRALPPRAMISLTSVGQYVTIREVRLPNLIEGEYEHGTIEASFQTERINRSHPAQKQRDGVHLCRMERAGQAQREVRSFQEENIRHDRGASTGTNSQNKIKLVETSTFTALEPPSTASETLDGSSLYHRSMHNDTTLLHGWQGSVMCAGGDGRVLCASMLQNYTMAPLSFLVGRHIQWFVTDYEDHSTPNYHTTHHYSGEIIRAISGGFIVREDDSNEEIIAWADTLESGAYETCIRVLMMRYMLGPTTKALLNDTTPHDIYELIDPRNNEVFYVGISKNALARYRQHVSCSSNSCPEKNERIQEIQAAGLQPILKVTEKVLGKFQAYLHEDYWIQYHISTGVKITNYENRYGENR